MNTDELIRLLAADGSPVPRAPAARRLAPAMLLGLLVALGLALLLIGPVPRPLLLAPAMGVKLAFGAAVLAAGAWWTARLARPAAPSRGARWLLAGVFLAMALAGLATLLATPAEQRLLQLMGHSWRSCPLNLLALALPALAGGLWALRGLAPVRPRLAGLAAGLTAGGVATLGYALACTEQATAFVAVWYSLGIVLSGVLGAALGPRVLRW